MQDTFRVLCIQKLCCEHYQDFHFTGKKFNEIAIQKTAVTIIVFHYMQTISAKIPMLTAFITLITNLRNKTLTSRKAKYLEKNQIRASVKAF